ncbi:uncharacterized protein L969DRAFT_51265 [Mixia osmundae IAM 14324]|uniref:uncharacterized protein n=1 Tax=Mixia osmundae (strain CBS 9802 / IAM 14324 / JCM 22182 / KY 12970) TaxID=764103 RepID=UPI0004A555D2|nr:uncharacterized protein L969DRAFT_51265 [Mixia osmundae IAM 14324]KEI38190.1 hypothetical protein L969DRAFT_51265 [Mixia osmundae IAM 14324]
MHPLDDDDSVICQLVFSTSLARKRVAGTYRAANAKTEVIAEKSTNASIEVHHAHQIAEMTPKDQTWLPISTRQVAQGLDNMRQTVVRNANSMRLARALFPPSA